MKTATPHRSMDPAQYEPEDSSRDLFLTHQDSSSGVRPTEVALTIRSHRSRYCLCLARRSKVAVSLVRSTFRSWLESSCAGDSAASRRVLTLQTGSVAPLQNCCRQTLAHLDRHYAPRADQTWKLPKSVEPDWMVSPIVQVCDTRRQIVVCEGSLR